MARIFITIFLFVSIFAAKAQNIATDPAKCVTGWLPAAKPDDAMLIGNGTMGAMVYGNPHNETIIVNHTDIWLPTTYPFKPVNQLKHLPNIRKLLLMGDGKQAAQIVVNQSLTEGYPGQIWNDPYVPAFNILLKTTAQNIDKYKTVLDYQTGEAAVTWQQNGNSFERRQFISRADSVLVINITASKAFNFSVALQQLPYDWQMRQYIDENVKTVDINADTNNIFYTCQFVKQWEPNVIGYNGVAQIKFTDGEIQKQGNQLIVNNAKNVLLLVKVDGVFFGQQWKTQQLKHAIDNINGTYDGLLSAHKNVHTKIYNRVLLKLNGPVDDFKLDGDVMVQQAKLRNSNAFVEKQFNAARYNILSATGKHLPNLQGIWGFSWQPPWASDYTHNGNLPVAISSFLCSNMPELMQPFFNYHNARLHYYRQNAQALYGCRGIQLPSHTSSHGYNVHFDKTWSMTFWNTGAAWASHFYYDYYLYTNDIEFLKNQAYPFMKESALFFEDFLTEGSDGMLIFNPSYSPENNPANNPSQAVINATMDIAITKELLRNVIAAGKIVGENKEQITKWGNMLKKMPAYQVDSTGAFREWLWPGYTENHYHRHISQLYGMYDIVDPEIAANPVLWAGVKKTVYERMKVRRNDNGGIMVFGLVQMAWVAANLGDADMVQEIINWLSSQYWSNSLATYHDPDGLFNMDLSGGFQTAVIRALVYTEPGFISVLPAKPQMWQSGSITGLKGRGQININSIQWQNNSASITLISAIKQKITLKVPAWATLVTANNNLVKAGKPDANNSVTINLPANTEIILSIK